MGLARLRSPSNASRSFGVATIEVAKIVTAFTVAHSITQLLATLGLVELPSRLVESDDRRQHCNGGVKESLSLVTQRMWLLAFGLGLVHGLGFAGALAALGMPPQAFLLSLLAFNLGIELGQLAIVALFLPVVYAYRTAPLYPRVVRQAASLAIGMLGGVWFMGRAFDLTRLG